jgi:hypothetical protein
MESGVNQPSKETFLDRTIVGSFRNKVRPVYTLPNAFLNVNIRDT